MKEMKEIKPWQVVNSKKLINHPFVQVIQDTLLHPDDGRTYDHYYLTGEARSVAVVALTTEQKIVLVRQYRHPVGQVIYDLPAGRVNKNEDLALAAKRELREETGYTAQHIEKLTFFNQFPGSMQPGTHLFFATQLQPGTQNLDQFEDIAVVELSVAETIDLILNNKTLDGSLMLGVLFAQARGLI